MAVGEHEHLFSGELRSGSQDVVQRKCSPQRRREDGSDCEQVKRHSAYIHEELVESPSCSSESCEVASLGTRKQELSERGGGIETTDASQD